MRILLVNDLAPGSSGGTEVYIERLARGLEDAGDSVEFFAGRIVHRGGLRVLDTWDPLARLQVAKAARAFGADVVHHHNVLRELSVSVLGVPKGVPNLLTAHGFRIVGSSEHSSRRWMTWAERVQGTFNRAVARRRLDAVAAVSATLAGRLRERGFRDVKYVGPFAPVPPSTLEQLPIGSTQDIVFAGRLVPEKGISVLADAFAVVAPRFPGSRLVVAGEGPLRTSLTSLASALGGDRVVLLGHVDSTSVVEMMARARVVVRVPISTLLPEGSSLTAVEAALLGRPVIVSDDPACRELVDDARCGLVVPAGSTEALVEALSLILSDAGLATRLGAAGRTFALLHHTTETAVTRYREIYARLLRPPPTGRPALPSPP